MINKGDKRQMAETKGQMTDRMANNRDKMADKNKNKMTET